MNWTGSYPAGAVLGETVIAMICPISALSFISSSPLERLWSTCTSVRPVQARNHGVPNGQLLTDLPFGTPTQASDVCWLALLQACSSMSCSDCTMAGSRRAASSWCGVTSAPHITWIFSRKSRPWCVCAVCVLLLLQAASPRNKERRKPAHQNNT